MDFVLALHSHMPYVLHHGRWPHGSDWLSEAAVDTYLPLLETLLALEKADVRAPVTLGITPVLANQLSHPDFELELSDYFDHRVEACDAAPETLARSGDAGLVGIAEYWRERFHRLRDLLHEWDCDLVAAFRALADRGRIEILSSAATHGFLPLLGRDESIRLQLLVGRAEHRRLFGRDPAGIWLPECAYRPSGPWAPAGAKPRAQRHGTGYFLSEAGYQYFFVDSHLADAGPALEYDGTEQLTAASDPATQGELRRSPYQAYRVPGAPRKPPLMALVRDPRSTLRVWSRQQGYPGDGAYLEFHKIRWPEGLKLWRVTGGGVDLGAKQPYDPAAARTRAYVHARHFAGFLAETLEKAPDGELIAAPFDTELFGHWWSEGPDFLGDLYRTLAQDGIRPTTAREHLAGQTGFASAKLREGSWGANGDFSMWLNPGTAWTWQRMWQLEDAFWGAARDAVRGTPAQRAILEQAARSLLLAQASDWQFVISTGAATDYAEKRFAGHCEDAERLVAALAPGAATDEALGQVEALRRRDAVFPDVLESVAAVVGR